MGIKPEQFPIIWQGIWLWMNFKDISPSEIARLTGYSKDRIEKGIKNYREWLSSDFLHDCVDVFGLRNARNRSPEDSADILTDEECIELITSILRKKPRQGNLWD